MKCYFPCSLPPTRNRAHPSLFRGAIPVQTRERAFLHTECIICVLMIVILSLPHTNTCTLTHPTQLSSCLPHVTQDSLVCVIPSLTSLCQRASASLRFLLTHTNRHRSQLLALPPASLIPPHTTAYGHTTQARAVWQSPWHSVGQPYTKDFVAARVTSVRASRAAGNMLLTGGEKERGERRRRRREEKEGGERGPHASRRKRWLLMTREYFFKRADLSVLSAQWYYC